jgi:hypothetical protein
MGERWMRSQVSSEGEVELKCLRVSEVLFVCPLPPVGRLASPFIVQGEGGGYIRERERDREEEGLEATSFFLSCMRVLLVVWMMMRMAPCRDIDVVGDCSTSWPCLPLAPYAGVVSRLWHPIPSYLTL